MKYLKLIILGLMISIAYASITNINVNAAETDDVILIYAETPNTFTAPHIWTWDDDGTGAFADLGWPGKEMISDPNNPGWYYLYIPSTMTNVIVNGNDGTVQGEAFAVNGQNVWVTFTEGLNAENETIYEPTLSLAQLTVGDLPTYVPTKYVYAYVPVEWDTAGVWAWSHPDGTNVFPSWPGQEMTLLDDGWFRIEIPTSANRVIINDMGDPVVQTIDIDIPTENVYIVLKELNNDGKYEVELFNEKPIFMEDAFEVYITVPDTWTTPHVWAWSHPDGTNLFTTWPGEPLVFDDESQTYKVIVPDWVNRIIINNGVVGDGAAQTIDTVLEMTETTYISVGDQDTEGKYLTTVTYDEEPNEETFDLYIYLDESWETPTIWAWSHPDGTNLFPTWPGESLVYDDEAEAYKISLPVSINRVIITNGLEGDALVQTIDTVIDQTDDTYIVIGELDEDGKYTTTVTYGQVPSFDEPVEDEPSNTPLIIGGIIVGTLVIGAAIFFVVKKK